MIEYMCPHCNNTLQIDDKYAGRAGSCMKCGKRITVPGTIVEPAGSTEASPKERKPKTVADSNSVLENNEKGKAFEKSDKIDDAIELYEKNLSIKAETPHPYNRLRIIYAKRRDFDNAIRVCKTAIKNVRHPTIDYVEKHKYVEHLEKLKDRKKAESKAIAEHTRLMRASGKKNYTTAKKEADEWKRWIAGGDGFDCDECESNQAMGWIPIDQKFQTNDLHNPCHPGCRCVVTYRTLPPDKFDQASVQEAINKTAEAKRQSNG